MNFAQLSRRSLLQRAATGVTAVAGIAGSVGATDAQAEPDFQPGLPVVDYHVHLSRALTIDKAVALANTRHVKFGIVEHPAPDGKIADDETLRRYLDMLKNYPVYRGLQPVYPDWAKPFSRELLAQLDYILMDALTLPASSTTACRWSGNAA